MKLKYHETKEPITIDVLTAKEVELGFRLPESYREFLLNVGNGAWIDTSDPENFGVGLAEIGGIGLDKDWLDLDDLLASYSERILPGFLPFGTTTFGDVVCISTRNEDSGTVWIWNHEIVPEFEDEPPLVESMFLVADTFERFTDGDYPELPF